MAKKILRDLGAPIKVSQVDLIRQPVDPLSLGSIWRPQSLAQKIELLQAFTTLFLEVSRYLVRGFASMVASKINSQNRRWY